MGIVKAFFLAVTAKVAAEEAKAWLPSISEHLLKIAVMRPRESESVIARSGPPTLTAIQEPSQGASAR